MPTPNLPKQHVFFEERSYTPDILGKCAQILSRNESYRDGYLTVRDGQEFFIGLLRDGKVARAGQIADGRAFELGSEIFAHIVSRAEAATFALHGAEELLYLTLESVLTKLPALHGSARYLPLPDLARILRREGNDAILTYGADGEINIAYFRRGQPFRLFPCDYLKPQAKGTILDQIEMYLVHAARSRDGREVVLSVYDQSPGCLPLAYAPSFQAASAPPTAAATPKGDLVVTIQLQGRTLRRVPINKDTMTIGRVKENDIVIDNLGVSREHCALVRTPQGILLEDRGSLNGVVVNDQLVRRAYLKEGDVLLVGKHRLIIGTEELHPKPVIDPRTVKAYEATMVLSSKVRPDLIQKAAKKGALPLAAVPEDPGAVELVEEPKARSARKDEKYARPDGDKMERKPRNGSAKKDKAPAAGAPVGEEQLPVPERPVPADDAWKNPRLIFGKTAFEMVAPVVTIGSGDDVDLKLDGFLVGGKQIARIVKDGTGRYKLVSLSRLHRPRINGATVSGEEILLDGDEVRVGKKKFVFAAQ